MTRSKFSWLTAFFIFSVGSSDGRESIFTMTKCVFDTINLSFHISWSADSSALGSDYEAGISATCGHGQPIAPDASFHLASLSKDTSFSLPRMLFDTLYTISVWTKRREVWIPPDSSCTRSVRVESSVRQPVSYFSSSAFDTVRALKGKVMLWKGADYPDGLLSLDDTITAFVPADSLLHGFVFFGTGMRFVNPPPSPPFCIALKCTGIPRGLVFSMCRLYKDSLGVFVAQREAIIDSVNQRIFVNTDDLHFPYVLLADTIRPTLRVLSDTARLIDSTSLTDSIYVSDNCANLAWKFFRGAGGEACTAAAAGFTKGNSGKINCLIPSAGARAAGIKAYVVISDSYFIDTIDLSHRAIRSHSDATTTMQNSIFPIASTAEPDNPDMRSCLGTLFSDAGGSYDPSAFRIFRWLPNESNAQSANKWIEYSAIDRIDFFCRPGSLFWLITAKSSIIDFGKSITPSLKSSYTIHLTPHNWTDFCVPFGFHSSLSNVLGASGPGAENLVIYRWLPDVSKNSYRAELVYGSRRVSMDSISDTLFSGSGTGYTVFNPADTAFNLRFPPFSFPLGNKFTGVSKKSSTNAGCIKISASEANKEFSTVFCGVYNGPGDTIVYPPPPSFSSSAINVRRPGGKASAIALYPIKNNDVQVFPLELINGDRPAALSAKIHASLQKEGKPVEFCFIKETINGYEKFLNDFEVSAAKGGHSDFSLVCGATERVTAYLNGLMQNSAHHPPMISYGSRNGTMHISFGNLEPGSQCNVSIFNVLGKCVVRPERIKIELRAGSAEAVTPKLPSGVYFLSSTIVDGSSIISEKKRITLSK